MITWLPFDLHPEYPPEGIPRAHLHARYGEAMHERLRARFAEEGLAYNPPPEVVPSTKLALQVAELAREHGLHDALHDRLMDAYWAEARDIGDAEVLRELAAETGLEDVEPALAGGVYAERVEATTRQAAAIGATGVPAFLLDRRLLVLGAQPPAVFARAFAQIG